jgi:sugar lactone lactonase YvrE
VLSALSAVVIPLGLAACSGGGAQPSGDAGVAETGADAGACVTSGRGTLAVTVEGLPEGIRASVILKKPDGTEQDVTVSTTLADVAAGTYALVASRVQDADPIVPTLFEPTVTPASVCVGAGETKTLNVRYAAHPVSNKLWMSTSNGELGDVVAFSSAQLRSGGAPMPSLQRRPPFTGSAVAFDRDGNLWATGGDSSAFQRFSAASLAASGDLQPERRYAIDFGCAPNINQLLVGRDGSVWASSFCGDGFIARYSAADLASGGDKPLQRHLKVSEPRGMAFDGAGNLWVAASGKVQRFDVARLGAPNTNPSDLVIQAETPAPESLALGADYLAFTVEGDLWVGDFTGTRAYLLERSNLTGAGNKTVVPRVILDVGVTALPTTLALDHSGGLWMPSGVGKFVRFDATQLQASGAPVPAATFEPARLGYAENLAFFPGVGPLASNAR